VRGELAGILALADRNKPAAEIRDGLEQIKLVAGARNRLNLLLAAASLPSPCGSAG